MTLAELACAGRTPHLPIQLDVAGGLELQSLLRVLPGQRYVGVALWQGRKVLAKLLNYVSCCQVHGAAPAGIAARPPRTVERLAKACAAAGAAALVARSAAAE